MTVLTRVACECGNLNELTRVACECGSLNELTRVACECGSLNARLDVGVVRWEHHGVVGVECGEVSVAGRRAVPVMVCGVVRVLVLVLGRCDEHVLDAWVCMVCLWVVPLLQQKRSH